MIYFDNAATTKPCDEAIKAFNCSPFGNPSSLHKLGIEAEQKIISAKKIILNKLSLEGEIIFTSSATESNNLALIGIANTYKRSGNKIVSTAVEHPSVQKVLEKLEEEGFDVIRIAPEKDKDFEAQIAENVDEKTILVTVMAVNNETGYITDTAKLERLIKQKNPKCIYHADGVQGFCKTALNADLISLSAHKIHGFKGIGCLFYKKGIRFSPLLLGGGQQKSLRSGTEPVELISSFGAAVLVYPNLTDKFAELNKYLINSLQSIKNININSFCNYPSILNFSVLGIRSEILLHFLEEHGIYVSSGSACSKGKKSSVLSAFGVNDKNIDSAIRVSFCKDNTKEEIDQLISALMAANKRFIRN